MLFGNHMLLKVLYGYVFGKIVLLGISQSNTRTCRVEEEGSHWIESVLLCVASSPQCLWISACGPYKGSEGWSEQMGVCRYCIERCISGGKDFQQQLYFH